MSWIDQLQPASFRGVPFGVLGSESRFGRRLAVHEYPYRDNPWAEDIGRSTRKINMTGFLVTDSLVYGGGNVFAQRDAMVAACEKAGSGLLVHPTLGQLTVSIPDGGLSVVEKWDQGRYFEIGFSFIESGKRVFPSLSTSTQDAVSSAAGNVDSAAAFDFSADIATPLQTGSLSLGQIIGTANAWGRQAISLVRDATSLVHLVTTLPGNFGRLVGVAAALDPTGTVASLIATGAEARALVNSTANLLNTAAAGLDIATAGTVATSAQALTASMLAATTNPADAVRLLSNLAGDTNHAPTQNPVGDLFRRAAVVSLARASSTYQPASSDDAVAIRATVTGLLDNEITIAGDQGDDATYSALRTLRLAVAQDLTTRSVGLPAVETFAFNASLPSLVLAQRLYQDPSRADELVQEAAPVHPAFMPTRFKALSN